jgi:hypothetical protein
MEQKPQFYRFIQPGLDKLKEYEDGLPFVPAYVIAMGVSHICFL